jgi:hypothetical protein
MYYCEGYMTLLRVVVQACQYRSDRTRPNVISMQTQVEWHVVVRVGLWLMQMNKWSTDQ